MTLAAVLLWTETSAVLTTVRRVRASSVFEAPPNYVAIGRPPLRPAQEKVEHMEVDPIRGARLRVNFDVTFPDMPCAGACVVPVP